MNIHRLENLPKTAIFNEYIWVDYFELKCLSSLDNCLTFSDIFNILIDCQDFETPYDEDDADEWDQSQRQPSRAKEEKIEQRAALYMEYFRFRSELYKDSYPFKLVEDRLEVIENITDQNLFYIYLLCCSSLAYFSSYQSTLTGEFEVIAKLCWQECCPLHGVIKIFGKNPISSDYSGNIFNRFKTLSHDLNETLAAQAASFSKSSTGDEGIDIIGWIPFDDNLNSKVVYIGQCKCSEEWKDAFEPASKLCQIIPGPKYIQLMFIPFCFRTSGGKWFVPHEANRFITIDRFRLVSLFSSKMHNFTTLNSYSLIKQFLTEKESAI